MWLESTSLISHMLARHTLPLSFALSRALPLPVPKFFGIHCGDETLDVRAFRLLAEGRQAPAGSGFPGSAVEPESQGGQGSWGQVGAEG